MKRGGKDPGRTGKASRKVSEEAAATFWRVMGNVVLATISKHICQIPPVETSPTFFPAIKQWRGGAAALYHVPCLGSGSPIPPALLLLNKLFTQTLKGASYQDNMGWFFQLCTLMLR